MSYIDQSDYKSLLNKFAQGTQKQKLQENYIDLMPINSLSEYKATESGFLNATYPGAKEMEEAEQALSPKQKKIAAAAPPEDKITGADFAAMKKDEGLVGDGPHATGQTIQTVEGLSLGNLSLEERTELKNYVDSIKTTKKAIQELLAKAKRPKMEGGDTTGKSLNLGPDQSTQAQDQETF